MKVAPGVAAGEVNEALQHQLKVLSWTVERERAARITACRKAEIQTLRRLRPLEHPTAPGAVARRQVASQLEKELNELQTKWTLFVARSGLVQFPSEPGKYARALQIHREKQRETKQRLEERLSALQAEARRQLLLHRPWRCVEADLAEFPAPDLAAAIAPKTVDIGTIKFPASDQGPNDDTIYVTPSQLSALRDLVAELQSDDIKLELTTLEPTVCAA